MWPAKPEPELEDGECPDGRVTIESKWPEPRLLEKAVIATAEEFRVARRRGRKPDPVELIKKLEELYDVLAAGQSLYVVNEIVKCFSAVAIDGAHPTVKEVTAWWTVMHNDTSPDTLREDARRVVKGNKLSELGEEWRTARDKSQQLVERLVNTDLQDTDTRKRLAEELLKTDSRQEAVAEKLKDLLRPRVEGFDRSLDFMAEYSKLRGERTPAEEDNRLRGLVPDGEKIHSARKEKKLSRQEFSGQIKEETDQSVSVRTIVRVEQSQPADKKTLEPIAKTLGMPLEEILKEE